MGIQGLTPAITSAIVTKLRCSGEGLYLWVRSEGRAMLMPGLLRVQVDEFPPGTLVRYEHAENEAYLGLRVTLPNTVTVLLHDDDVIQSRILHARTLFH